MERGEALWSGRQVLWGLGLGLASILLLGLGMALVLQLGGQVVPAFLVLGAVVEGLLLAIAFLSTRRLPGGAWRALGLGTPLKGEGVALSLLTFGGSLFFAAAYILFLARLGLVPHSSSLAVGPPLAGAERLALFLLVAVIAPLAEEAFYRGFLFQGLRSVWGTGRALLLSSALFSLSHGLPLLFLPAFVAGLLFSLLFLRTRSLWAPVLAHALQNGLVALLVF